MTTIRAARIGRAGRLVWVPLLALALAGCPGSRPGTSATREADDASSPAAESRPLAPDFTLLDLDGSEVSLRSLRGHTVLIDFWATWCAPCVYQIPVLNEFHAAHRGDGVVVLGIAVDAEGRDVVAPFADEHDIQYRVLLGNEAIARRYGAPGFPSLVVIDPNGHIEDLHVGLIERDSLEAMAAAAASVRLVGGRDGSV